ncbi:PQQ-binding-like beta-propeller repeat protein [Halorientalis pallida]|uniref:outer membrane protein assembly factor BamB family protein n=1 Tax=Halorientalis pallida TaxID=2479928 RepID=UPI003C6F3830
MTDQRQWSRRRWLAAASSTATLALAGCSSSDDGDGTGPGDDASTPAGNDGNGDTSNSDGDTNEQSFEGPVTADGEWPVTHYDAANTRSTTASGPPVAVQERWSAEITGEWADAPLVVGESVYVATDEGSCYAHDLLSGEQRWVHDLSPETIFSLAAGEDRVYIGWGGGITAVTPDNTVTWERSLGEFVLDLLVADGTVYARGQERLFARDVETGDEVWTTTVPDGLSNLAVADGSVFMKDREQFKAYDAGTGDRQWAVEHAGALGDAGVAIADGTAYFMADGNIEARSIDDGALEWRWSDGTAEETVPAVADGVVYAQSLGKGGPYRIDGTTGDNLGTIEVDGYTGHPAVASGTVYFSMFPDLDADTRLYAVDADSLDVRWQTTMTGGTGSTPVVLEDLLLYPRGSGLAVLEPA